MKFTDHLTSMPSRFRLARHTVRLRLTVLYSVLFLAAGASLLTITYLLVRAVPNGKVDNALLPSPVVPGSKPLSKPPTGVAVKQLRAQALATHAIDMHEMLIWSGVALAIMAVLAIGLGWLFSGRMLRPLRTITTTTQRITEHNLHERLALTGPRDEVKDLADTIDGLLQRLAAAFDAQRHFVANASHELRTPLTLNRALLDVTLADPEATVHDLRAMSQELIASGEHQERLIESLLTLAVSTADSNVTSPSISQRSQRRCCSAPIPRSTSSDSTSRAR